MKKKICAWMLAALTVAFSTVTPAMAYADVDSRQEVEIPELEEGSYAQGEALVSMTATQAAALTKEGSVGFDRKIEVEECWSFGQAENASSEQVQDYVALITSDAYSTEELMEIAADRFYVNAVAPNGYMHLYSNTNDELSAYQWYLDGADALRTNSQGIHAASSPSTDLSQTVVAVVDTGVDYNNSELMNSMWINPYNAKGLAGTYGYDFANGDADPMDTLGHGTHCAGVIAAQTNNGTGIAGLTNAKIMALKVVRDGDEIFTTASVVAALQYIVKAQQLGVHIGAVNCSWGGSFDTGNILENLINKIGENGALSIFAAGNSNINWDKVPKAQRETPYDIDSPYVVVVGASNEKDNRAAYSDYGNTQVDLLAPGSNILSTIHQSHFLPQVWSQTKRSQLISYYNTIGDLSGLYTASDIGISSDYQMSISYDSNRGCLDQTNGSICVTTRYQRGSGAFRNGSKESAAFLYLDVTDMHLNPSAIYYVSCLLGTDDSTYEMNWESVEKTSTPANTRFVTVGDRTYLSIVGMSTTSTETMTYYIDDIAVSVENPDISQFGKYDLMSGTSMAAPMVTAAAAILSGVNPKATAVQLRSALMKCVRYVDAIDNTCVTGGILDLQQVTTLATGIKLNRTKATLRYGKSLRLTATVTPKKATNTKVKWTSSNTRYAIVSSTGLVKPRKAGIGKTVTITATTRDGTKVKKSCKIKIIKAR